MIGNAVAEWLADQSAFDGVDVKSSSPAKSLESDEEVSCSVITTNNATETAFGGRSSVATASVLVTLAYNRTLASVVALRRRIHAVLDGELNGFAGELASGTNVLSAQLGSFTEEVSENDDLLYDSYDFDILYRS